MKYNDIFIAAIAVGSYTGSIKQGLITGLCWFFGVLIGQSLIYLFKVIK